MPIRTPRPVAQEPAFRGLPVLPDILGRLSPIQIRQPDGLFISRRSYGRLNSVSGMNLPHVEQLETSLAGRSDKFRESIPDSYLRTLYDRQVGRTKGTNAFAKSLIGTGLDAALLLQKLTSPVGWLDPDLQRKLQQGFSLGVAVSKVYVKWEFGTLHEKKQVLQEVGTLAERVYQEASNNIQRQWAEAERTGKEEELIERWKTRLLFEVGTLVIGAGELKGASAAAKEVEAANLLEDAQFTKPSVEPPWGLAYRKDFDEHLAGSEIPTEKSFSGKTLSGTHNLDNAKAALATKQDVSFSLTATSKPGIYEMNYKYYNPTKGDFVSGMRKTVYDPKIFDDETMLNMAQDAGQKGFDK